MLRTLASCWNKENLDVVRRKEKADSRWESNPGSTTDNDSLLLGISLYNLSFVNYNLSSHAQLKTDF